MELFASFSNRKLLLIGLISALFIIYPHIVCLVWEFSMGHVGNHSAIFYNFFLFRFLYFWALFVLQLRYNFFLINNVSLKKRIFRNFIFSGGAYLLFILIYFVISHYGVHDFWGSMLFFQFFVVCSLSTLTGHIFQLYTKQQEKEREIERLKTENLQSRCDALMHQINPHFFFNSLNGISALIRKKDDLKTLKYVDELSDIFRYILQSDRKGIVTLREELDFIEAFRYVMEVRFANKLTFTLTVNKEQKDSFKLPVLSLLPLVDNVVVHNMIDIDHKMDISIYLNQQSELVISNPIFPKLSAPETNGTGLKNLESRFFLLMNKKVRIEENNDVFNVYLPLK